MEPKLKAGTDCCDEFVGGCEANGFEKLLVEPAEKLNPPPLLPASNDPPKSPPAVGFKLGAALPEVVSPNETVDIGDSADAKESALRLDLPLWILDASLTFLCAAMCRYGCLGWFPAIVKIAQRAATMTVNVLSTLAIAHVFYTLSVNLPWSSIVKPYVRN